MSAQPSRGLRRDQPADWRSPYGSAAPGVRPQAPAPRLRQRPAAGAPPAAAPAPPVQPGGLLDRFLARLIDGILVGMVNCSSRR